MTATLAPVRDRTQTSHWHGDIPAVEDVEPGTEWSCSCGVLFVAKAAETIPAFHGPAPTLRHGEEPESLETRLRQWRRGEHRPAYWSLVRHRRGLDR